MKLKEGIGEAFGTFIIVLFGCGSVAGAVLFQSFSGLFQVAAVWGLGVILAIYLSRGICPAHLNPAVTVAMWLNGAVSFKRGVFFIFCQVIGAFLGALILYLFIKDSLTLYELKNLIVRGELASRQTAMIFGEFYPNPGFEKSVSINWYQAMFGEFVGTFMLVLAIFKITGSKDVPSWLSPILIGMTVSLIICLIAPLTQAGLNPARDFGPRLFAFLAGWDRSAFPQEIHGFFTVYILAPVLAGVFATYCNKLLQFK